METQTNNSFKLLQDNDNMPELACSSPKANNNDKKTKKGPTLYLYVEKSCAKIKDLINLLEKDHSEGELRINSPRESLYISITTKNPSTYAKIKLTS